MRPSDGAWWSRVCCLGVLAALVGVVTPALAQRVSADVDCGRTTHDLVFDCRILLKDAGRGRPVGGAEVLVGADMPSMPMAHSVRPVKATPGTAPGEYHARIELEMFGEWVLRLSVSGPARDVVVKKLQFLPPE